MTGFVDLRPCTFHGGGCFFSFIFPFLDFHPISFSSFYTPDFIGGLALELSFAFDACRISVARMNIFPGSLNAMVDGRKVDVVCGDRLVAEGCSVTIEGEAARFQISANKAKAPVSVN